MDKSYVGLGAASEVGTRVAASGELEEVMKRGTINLLIGLPDQSGLISPAVD